MERNKYYITGGAGFIGRHLNRLLGEENVVNIDLRTHQVVRNQIVSDIRDKKNIENTIGDSNIIVHLAASHYDFEKDYNTTNVVATKHLLEVASQKEINRFIFFSSVAVYGSNPNPADENSELNPDNDYGRSKLEAERIIQEWAFEKEERQVIIIRPAVVFGAYNFGNLFNLTRNIDRGLNVHIGNRPVIKSVAYVENLVDATKYLIDRFEGKFEIYNYVDEPQLSNIEISENIGAVLGKNKSLKIPYGIALTLGYFFDLVGILAKKELLISERRVKKFCTPTHFVADKIRENGFESRFTTKEALTLTTEWFDKNREVWKIEHERLKKLFKSNYGITIE